MKYIKSKFILPILSALIPMVISAQIAPESAILQLNNTKDSVVQVAYRKVEQKNLLGSVSVVNYDNLTQRNYNTYSLDNMQGYVGGWNGASLWGMDSYLVLVDGVPRDANNVLPTEIEQITFLKGASAVVLYGSRAAKGIIHITTKRGKAQGLQVSARVNTGFNITKSYPKYLGSAEYMTLYNEARTNDGLSKLYSDVDIYNYSTGSNTYRYPDVDFYSSDYINKYNNRTDAVAEITGGNRFAKFYTNIGYYRQNDVFKFGQAANNSTDRLNVRGNIDMSISNYISAFVNANATFYNSNTAKGNYWTAASTMRPNRVSPLIPISFINPKDALSLTLIQNSSNIVDGLYFLGGTQVDQTNIFADYYAAGSNKWTSRQFQFDTGIDIDLVKVLKGLSFHTQLAVDYATSYNTSYDNTYAVFEPVWSNYNGYDVISSLVKYNSDKKSGIQNISGSTNKQTIAFNGYFDYKTSIDNIHNFNAMLIAAGYQQTESQVYHRTTNANLGLQLGYNYLSKYFAEFDLAAVHSAKLAPGHRNALSPSFTLGWKLSNEDFLANTAVDDLMLNVSGSILNTDMDISDYYIYDAKYDQANGAWWGWNDAASEHSTNSLRGANENLTFIKRKELSANIRTSLWKKLITADASVFINSIEGLVIRPATIFPDYFSTYYPNASFIPYYNFENNMRSGFDFNVNLNKRLGEVDLSLGISGTYYTTKATKRDENYQYSYQNRQGKPIDAIFGLENQGFFSNATDIASHETQKFAEVAPGDIKYKDQNADGIIDEKDEVYLGRGGWYGLPFTMGVNFTVKWNNLTFFALGTGGFGAYAMKNNSYYWVYGERKYSEIVRNRWTEATKETASYPRLTTQSGTNNFRNSDFWLYKNDRFNIAKVQLTYDFPKRALQDFFIHELSAYVSGANLLTISNVGKILEMNVGSAPQTRFYNIGVKATF
ncbi:MAG: SusC/RagA family TonB-linked outer membrane protein [Paludibacteraceae bacterium]